jgi:hypothetical protein
MATSGSKSIAATPHDTLKFSWSVISQDIANNSTKISWKMEMIADGYGEIKSTASKAWSITIDGTEVKGTNTIGLADNATKTLANGTATIYHYGDGTCTFSYSFSQEINIKWDGTQIGTKSGSGTGTLDTIPRQATLTSVSSFTDKSNPTIKYSNPAGSAVSSLQACISLKSDASTADVGYRNVNKTGTLQYTFPLTTAEKNTLINATSGNSRTVYFCLKTTIGGKDYKSILAATFSLSDTSISFSPTAYDTNSRTTALTGDSSKIIKGYSNLYYSAGASAAIGSISSITATCGGVSKTTSTGTFSGAQSATINFTAKDSRGNNGSGSISKTLINYFKPTLQLKIIPTTTNGDLTIQISGTFFNGSFGKVKNTLTCRYSISHEGSGYTSGSSFDLNISGNSYSGSITITGLNYKNAYIVGVNAYDELEEVQINNQRTVGKPVFDWDNEEVNFNTDVRVRGNLRLKGDGNYGNTLYFGDGAYAYMTEATDDDLTFHSTDLTLDATNLALKSTNNAKLTGSIDVSKSVNVSLDVNCSNTVNAARVNIGGKDVGGQKDLATGINKFMHGTQS